MLNMRWIGLDPVDQTSPELWLPSQVRVEVFGLAVQPAFQKVRPLPRIRSEQAGEPPRDRVAAALAQLFLLALLELSEMGRQRGAPTFAEVFVDDFQQRPCHGIRRPGVVIGRAGDLGDQRLRVTELDARANPVAAVADAKKMAESLTQPSLNTLGRHEYQLQGQGVWQRICQYCAQPVSKQIGALGTVNMQCHRRHHRS